MRRYLLIAILLIFLTVLGLFIFKKQGKITFSSLIPKQKHSFVNSLPFEKKNKIKEKHSLLLAKLSPNQIYLENIIITPNNAPRGTYVSLSLVIEFRDPKFAKKMRERKDFLKNLVVENSSSWDYLDFKNMDGLLIVKKEIFKIFKENLGSKIEKLYLVEYKLFRQRRL